MNAATAAAELGMSVESFESQYPRTDFKQGDRVLYSGQFAGTVQCRLDYCYDAYEVRLRSGLTVAFGRDLVAA